jgi:hypothetical protein
LERWHSCVCQAPTERNDRHTGQAAVLCTNNDDTLLPQSSTVPAWPEACACSPMSCSTHRFCATHQKAYGPLSAPGRACSEALYQIQAPLGEKCGVSMPRAVRARKPLRGEATLVPTLALVTLALSRPSAPTAASLAAEPKRLVCRGAWTSLTGRSSWVSGL